MATPTHATGAAAAPMRARAVAASRTLIVVVIAWFAGALDVSFGTNALEASRGVLSDAAIAWSGLLFLVVTAAAVALLWRRRWPVQICAGSAVLALAVPVGFFVPLWTLVWVLTDRRRRDVIVCLSLTTAAVTVGLWRDFARGEHAVITGTDELTGETAAAGPLLPVVVGVFCLGGAVAIGLVRRFRASARVARAAEQAQLQTAKALRTELTRQEERDQIAREMHDSVAHHLSLVSLHASALEVTASDPGTDIPEVARSMRSSAHLALEEMRTLISSLREGQLADMHGYYTDASLEDLATLVEDARAAGADLRPLIIVSGADRASPALTRAVYRIVQECLTNALKHAPGAAVTLEVTASPARGVEIVAANDLTGVAPGPGSRSGQEGMRERALALGGTFEADAHRGRYRVSVHLPWSEATPP